MTPQSLLILGRQPALGLTELESRFGSIHVRPAGSSSAVLNISASEIPFEQLGGSVKLAKVLMVLDSVAWSDIEDYLRKAAPEHAGFLPEGKLQLGLSAYGFPVSAQKLLATGLTLKKTIQKTGRSVRLTPNQEPTLSSAQVFHNHLTGPTGWELLLVRDGEQTILAQTTAVQDIDSYTLRDRGRPKRDARVGMLPPKLAQIIINLAVGQASEKTILDPFCGTGVVLQEALLMGFNVYGTDLESRMIDFSGENLDWLDTHFTLPEVSMRIEQGDATDHQWNPEPDFIACETYLGRPFTTAPSSEMLQQTISEVNLIIKKFLRNVAGQIKPGTRLCLAIPAWHVGGKFTHLPLIDQLHDLGYNRVRFEHVKDDQLLYYREDQIVGRELLVITRK